MNDFTQAETKDRKDNRLMTALTGLRDWVDARLPVVAAWKKHMSQYYAPNNFNFWYFFGVLSLLVLVIQSNIIQVHLLLMLQSQVVGLLELELIESSLSQIKRSLKVTQSVLVRTPWLQGLLQLQRTKQSRYHLVANSPSYKYRSNQIEVWH